MKRRWQKQTEGEDNEGEETEQRDHRVQFPTESSSRDTSSNLQSHRTTARSTQRQSTTASTMVASAPMQAPSDSDREKWELDHKRKSSRLSSMRHQTRKRIEMEHLMELQAKLRTINAHLRQENESLRNIVTQFREAAISVNGNSGPAQANQGAQGASTANAPNTTTSNTDQKPFINNVLALFQVLNDSELSAQYEPQQGQRHHHQAPPSMIAPPAPPAQPPVPVLPQPTARLPQSLELELMQQRLNQVPLRHHQAQQQHFPFSQAAMASPNLPYAAVGSSAESNPQTIQSSLNLLNNYSFWQQQGVFGGVPLPSNIFLPSHVNAAGVHQLNPSALGMFPTVQGIAQGGQDEDEDEESKPRAEV